MSTSPIRPNDSSSAGQSPPPPSTEPRPQQGEQPEPQEQHHRPPLITADPPSPADVGLSLPESSLEAGNNVDLEGTVMTGRGGGGGASSSSNTHATGGGHSRHATTGACGDRSRIAAAAACGEGGGRASSRAQTSSSAHTSAQTSGCATLVSSPVSGTALSFHDERRLGSHRVSSHRPSPNTRTRDFLQHGNGFPCVGGNSGISGGRGAKMFMAHGPSPYTPYVVGGGTRHGLGRHARGGGSGGRIHGHGTRGLHHYGSVDSMARSPIAQPDGSPASTSATAGDCEPTHSSASGTTAPTAATGAETPHDTHAHVELVGISGSTQPLRAHGTPKCSKDHLSDSSSEENGEWVRARLSSDPAVTLDDRGERRRGSSGGSDLHFARKGSQSPTAPLHSTGTDTVHGDNDDSSNHHDCIRGAGHSDLRLAAQPVSHGFALASPAVVATGGEGNEDSAEAAASATRPRGSGSGGPSAGTAGLCVAPRGGSGSHLQLSPSSGRGHSVSDELNCYSIAPSESNSARVSPLSLAAHGTAFMERAYTSTEAQMALHRWHADDQRIHVAMRAAGIVVASSDDTVVMGNPPAVVGPSGNSGVNNETGGGDQDAKVTAGNALRHFFNGTAVSARRFGQTNANAHTTPSASTHATAPPQASQPPASVETEAAGTTRDDDNDGTTATLAVTTSAVPEGVPSSLQPEQLALPSAATRGGDGGRSSADLYLGSLLAFPRRHTAPDGVAVSTAAPTMWSPLREDCGGPESGSRAGEWQQAAVAMAGGGGGRSASAANRNHPGTATTARDGVSYVSNNIVASPPPELYRGSRAMSSAAFLANPNSNSSRASISFPKDPLAASIMMQQNRSALIVELERRRERLKKQLALLQKEATARNVFALVRSSNASQLQYLLQQKLCNVNERDYNGCTPLHVAAGEGNQAIVSVLLSFGADVLAVDHHGRTPLDCAAASRHSGVGRYLLAVIRGKMQREGSLDIPANNVNDSTGGGGADTNGTSGSFPGFTAPASSTGRGISPPPTGDACPRASSSSDVVRPAGGEGGGCGNHPAHSSASLDSGAATVTPPASFSDNSRSGGSSPQVPRPPVRASASSATGKGKDLQGSGGVGVSHPTTLLRPSTHTAASGGSSTYPSSPASTATAANMQPHGTIITSSMDTTPHGLLRKSSQSVRSGSASATRSAANAVASTSGATAAVGTSSGGPRGSLPLLAVPSYLGGYASSASLGSPMAHSGATMAPSGPGESRDRPHSTEASTSDHGYTETGSFEAGRDVGPVLERAGSAQQQQLQHARAACDRSSRTTAGTGTDTDTTVADAASTTPTSALPTFGTGSIGSTSVGGNNAATVASGSATTDPSRQQQRQSSTRATADDAPTQQTSILRPLRPTAASLMSPSPSSTFGGNTSGIIGIGPLRGGGGGNSIPDLDGSSDTTSSFADVGIQTFDDYRREAAIVRSSWGPSVHQQQQWHGEQVVSSAAVVPILSEHQQPTPASTDVTTNTSVGTFLMPSVTVTSHEDIASHTSYASAGRRQAILHPWCNACGLAHSSTAPCPAASSAAYGSNMDLFAQSMLSEQRIVAGENVGSQPGVATRGNGQGDGREQGKDSQDVILASASRAAVSPTAPGSFPPAVEGGQASLVLPPAGQPGAAALLPFSMTAAACAVGAARPPTAPTGVKAVATATTATPPRTASQPPLSCADEDKSLAEEVADHASKNPHYSSYSTVSDTVSLVVCMCGLPGRGKSFISKRLVRYMNWKGVPCRVFNAGNYRRQLLGVEGTAGADFFDPDNPAGKELREKMAELACTDLVRFLCEHPLAIGILDATNTTKARRRKLKEFFEAETEKYMLPHRILFIESVCTDETIITENILRSKCDNDDFKTVKDTNAVIAEFRDRIQQYEKVYETLEPVEEVPYIKIINVKHHVVIHRLHTGLGSRIAFFLLNLHPIAYPIYIALPGETRADAAHVFGGDERLTSAGEAYAIALKHFIQERYVPNMVVLHATNRSVLATLHPLITDEDDGTFGGHGGAGGGAITPSGVVGGAMIEATGVTTIRSQSGTPTAAHVPGMNDSSHGSVAPATADATTVTAATVTGVTSHRASPARWPPSTGHNADAALLVRGHHGKHRHVVSPTFALEQPLREVKFEASTEEELQRLRAMAGGDLQDIPIPEQGAVVSLTRTANEEKQNVAEAAAAAAAASPATTVVMPGSPATNHDDDEGEGDEDAAEEILCPVPGLDNINYGRFSGRSAKWVAEKYPRLSSLLYVTDDRSAGPNSHAAASDSLATSGKGRRARGLRYQDANPLFPDYDRTASAAAMDSTTSRGTSPTSNSPTVSEQLARPAPPPIHFAKMAEALQCLTHTPSSVDPRLSYCVQFPNGESSRQVNVRLEPALMAVMRTQSPVFVVAPPVPAEGMLAFFADVIPELSPTLRIPKHCVIEMGVKDDVTVHRLLASAGAEGCMSLISSPVLDRDEIEETLRMASSMRSMTHPLAHSMNMGGLPLQMDEQSSDKIPQ